jgi:methanogenic corrinoid protein MtbC1
MTFLGGTGDGTSKAAADTDASQPNGMARGRKAGVSSRMARLVRAVEAEIVPRLLLSRRSVAPTPVPANAEELDPGDAAELARLLLVYDIEIPMAYVDAIRSRGVPVQSIYLNLLAPAARRLGLLWERDECDFLQVTVGLGRLHQLLQRLSLADPEPPPVEVRGSGRRALLATAPGEQHAFGILMVTQFFRQSGWEVWNEFPESSQQLVGCVRQHSFALVGLSAGTRSRVETLATTIRQLRRASLNPGICVMVGGPLLVQQPELATRVGADATALDGREAALRAESVCTLLAASK